MFIYRCWLIHDMIFHESLYRQVKSYEDGKSSAKEVFVILYNDERMFFEQKGVIDSSYVRTRIYNSLEEARKEMIKKDIMW